MTGKYVTHEELKEIIEKMIEILAKVIEDGVKKLGNNGK